MLFTAKSRSVLFKAFAVLFLLTAIYHAAGLFIKINESPIWRHLLFVGINLFCVYGFLKRPKYFVYLFVLLLIQQYYSHGTDLVHLWNDQKQIDWISFFDLLILPIVLICLVEDSHAKQV